MDDEKWVKHVVSRSLVIVSAGHPYTGWAVDRGRCQIWDQLRACVILCTLVTL